MRNDILDQATAIRASMDKVTTNLTDEEALQVVELYQPWAVDVAYAVDDVRRDEGILYRCI